MAIIQHTRAMTKTSQAFAANWGPMANGDVGESIPFAQFTDKSMQVFGAFGVGGAARLEGSNDGNNWAALHDLQGNVLDITSAKIVVVAEATAFVRPSIVAGDGTTQLTVCLLAKE